MKNLFNQKIIRHFIAQCKFSLSLLKNSPKDYIYSFFVSNEKVVTIRPYDPRSKKIAQEIIRSIKNVAPKLSIIYFGSSKLEISGRRDIDLFVEVKRNDFDTYLPLFVKLFKAPTKRRRKAIEWRFKRQNYTVEISMVDPKSTIYKRQEKLNKILNENKKILKEYEVLKRNLNGHTQRTYVRMRMKFFNDVLNGNITSTRNIFT